MPYSLLMPHPKSHTSAEATQRTATPVDMDAAPDLDGCCPGARNIGCIFKMASIVNLEFRGQGVTKTVK